MSTIPTNKIGVEKTTLTMKITMQAVVTHTMPNRLLKLLLMMKKKKILCVKSQSARKSLSKYLRN